MRGFLILTFCLAAQLSFAHGSDTTYDESGNVYSICHTHEENGITDCKYYYKTGQLYQIGSLKDTLRVGNWVSYYRNHFTKDSIYYAIIQKEGIEVSVKDSFAFYYFSNGAIRTRGTFDEDKKTGKWITNFPDGREKEIVRYKNDVRDGQFHVNYRNGKLREKGVYAEGMRIGMWNTYHKNGQLWGVGEFQEDIRTGEWVWNYDNGKLQAKGLFNKEGRSGVWTYHHRNGQLMKTGTFLNNEEEGEWKFYFDDGELEAEGGFKLGNKEGAWKEREVASTDSSGVRTYGPFMKGEYELDKRTGDWYIYYENGKPKEMWTYVLGQQTGSYKAFYPNGKLKTHWRLIDGRLLQVFECRNKRGKQIDCGTVKLGSGTVTILDEKGKPLRTEVYKDGYIQSEEKVEK
ncbi:MAG: hypothetical protein MI810_20620 [Flavobacteriales bacterium]|nr:hypothetical protein [Flavobacteriales bacterium]